MQKQEQGEKRSHARNDVVEDRQQAEMLFVLGHVGALLFAGPEIFKLLITPHTSSSIGVKRMPSRSCSGPASRKPSRS